MNLRVYKAMVSNSVQQVMIYRTTSILTVIFGIIFYFTEMFLGNVYFSYTDNIAGWTKWDYFTLVTTASMIENGYNLFFVWGDSYLIDAVIKGELDYMILRPVNSFWYYSLYKVDFPSLINIMMAAGVQSWLMGRHNTDIIHILIYIFFVLLGIWFVFLLQHLVSMVCFWKERSDQLSWIPYTLLENAARPAPVYPKAVKYFIMWALPMLTAINIPVDIIRNKVDIPNMLWYVGFTVLLSIGVYRMWYAGLRRYQSSS